jgi:membrane-associated protease RseP (regulator of RpoE activity)
VRSLAITVVSVSLSLLIGGLTWSWRFAAVFCLLVLAHEIGHWTVARVGGISVGGPMVIFPLGGVAFAMPWRRVRHERAHAAVIAAGPLSGALFGTLAAGYWLLTHNPDALWFARASATFNLLQLTPVGVLDGGRLARLAGLPTILCVLACIPAIVGNWWLALAIAPALLADRVIKPPDERHERVAVRQIALGGGLLAAAWLLTLQIALT